MFFSAIFCILVAGAYSAVIPLDSTIEEKPVSYLATVHYGELPEDGMYYEYIQPLGVYDHAKRVYVEPKHHERRRRQVTSTISGNNDGILKYQKRVSKPLYSDDKHSLSAEISASSTSADKSVTSGMGLNYENINGHGASLSGKHIPGLGNQFTAAGRLNLMNTDEHRLDANAYHTKTFLENNGPTLNTNGGSLDYLYNNRHGASLGVSHTDLLKSTTYSGMGKLNLFQSPSRDMSLDLNAGLTKTMSPFMESTGWQPTYGFSFTKSW